MELNLKIILLSILIWIANVWRKQYGPTLRWIAIDPGPVGGQADLLEVTIFRSVGGEGNTLVIIHSV